MNKREFIKNLSILGVSSPVAFLEINTILKKSEGVEPESLATDEDFWSQMRKAYKIKSDYINLENGYYCMLPEETLEAYIKIIRKVNLNASWYMRTEQWENKKNAAASLAKLAGCSEKELIITRNTTESLDMVIAGYDWKPGDEAIMALQDYGAMLNQFKMMERRFGVKNKMLSLPNHPKSDDEIVDLYASAITDKTRLLMVCHIVNITGQILPVKKICDMAHEKGVDVMIDGAHAFGHLDFNLSDIGCDYYGTSLHKWMSVPLGAGFLYVNDKKINDIWPLFAEEDSFEDSILRLNHTGTHPVHTDLAIEDAIAFHNKIGIKRKEERLRYLQRYWTSKVRDFPGVLVNTPEDPARHCAIGNVGIPGMKPKDLAEKMLKEHDIWTVAIDRPGVAGLRITPNVYTSIEELDKFVEAIKTIASA